MMDPSVFIITDPDHAISPETGMGRRHWIAAGRWLLSKYEGLYDAERQEFVPPESADRLSDRFEFFARLCMLVLPLAKADPRTRIAGFSASEYLELSLRRYCLRTSPDFIGEFGPGPSPFQLVQWAGLVTALVQGPEGLWESLPNDVREQSLDVLAAAASHRTNTHNWRFFNLLGWAFLARCERPVDEEAEREHLIQLESWHAGQGWYRDGEDFDYYTAWAFQTYAALWSTMDRSQRYPEIRSRFLDRFSRFIKTYPRFFSSRGESLLWGRSALYRFAASAPLAAAFKLETPDVSGGVARRICSGNLLQFLWRRDVWDGETPTMGFYRTFPPVLQRYSRRSSFGWMHKTFGCLSLPAESPFWTSREEPAEVYRSPTQDLCPTVSLPGPGLVIGNDPASGVAILIPGKVRSAEDPNYNRLAYTTSCLLEATTPSPVPSLSYEAATRAHGAQSRLSVSRIRYGRVVDGVVYRQIFLGSKGGHHSSGLVIDLADILIPGGILRVDRIRASFAHTLWLGGFVVPGHQVPEARPGGVTTVTGVSAVGPPNDAPPDTVHSTIALLAGWDGVEACRQEMTHAEYPRSTTLAARRTVETDTRGTTAIVAAVLGYLPPSDMLIPVLHLGTDPDGRNTVPEGFGGTIEFPNGTTVVVSFEDIEGRLSE